MELINELGEFFRGEIWDSKQVLDRYSRDGSVFELRPQLVAAPKSVKDIEQLLALLNHRAQQGMILPITARGKGKNQTGGAIGQGVILHTPLYLNRIQAIKDDTICVEAGALAGDVLRALARKGRWLPIDSSMADFASVGGLLANNTSGPRTAKYGSLKDYVVELKAVLADGSAITTRPLSRNELAEKLSLKNSLEGDIYRGIKELLEKHQPLIKRSRPRTTKTSSGYFLWEVIKKDKFDLSPLLVGSEGTLAIITEIVYKSLPLPNYRGLLLGYCSDLGWAVDSARRIIDLSPSAVEVIDAAFIKEAPLQELALGVEAMKEPTKSYIISIEFDEQEPQVFKEKLKLAQSMLMSLGITMQELLNGQQLAWWRARASAFAHLHEQVREGEASPFVIDSVVPVELLFDYLAYVAYILQQHDMSYMVWVSVGEGGLRISLKKPNYLEKPKQLLKILEKLHEKAASLNGAQAGEHGDGKLRSPHLPVTFGREMADIFQRTKRLFDPYQLLNP